jgi:hypothetical protein
MATSYLTHSYLIRSRRELAHAPFAANADTVPEGVVACPSSLRPEAAPSSISVWFVTCMEGCDLVLSVSVRLVLCVLLHCAMTNPAAGGLIKFSDLTLDTPILID